MTIISFNLNPGLFFIDGVGQDLHQEVRPRLVFADDSQDLAFLNARRADKGLDQAINIRMNTLDLGHDDSNLSKISRCILFPHDSPLTTHDV